MNTIIADAGGKVLRSFEFTFHGDNLSLQWEGDMRPLTKSYGELTNYMMAWVRAWLNPQLEDVKSHVCCPYLTPLLRTHLEEEGRDSLEVYIGFLHDKYGALPELDITTLIVPFTCGKHWSVYVVGDHGFFHFDSMITSGLHSDSQRRVDIAKLWAARRGYGEGSERWLQAQSPSVWIQPDVPQQNSGWACGFYMLKNIMEFTKTQRHRPQTLCEVNET